MAFIANCVVLMTFFIGFLLFADADSGKYEDSKVSFGALLIFSNLAAVAVGCGYISHDRFGVAAPRGTKSLVGPDSKLFR